MRSTNGAESSGGSERGLSGLPPVVRRGVSPVVRRHLLLARNGVGPSWLARALLMCMETVHTSLPVRFRTWSGWRARTHTCGAGTAVV